MYEFLNLTTTVYSVHALRKHIGSKPRHTWAKVRGSSSPTQIFRAHNAITTLFPGCGTFWFVARPVCTTICMHTRDQESSSPQIAHSVSESKLSFRCSIHTLCWPQFAQMLYVL